MSHYILVVVDMQPRFGTPTNRRLIREVKREIQKAITDEAPIIVLEYKHWGKTNRNITSMVRAYEKGYFAVKCDDDGSDETIDLCNTYRLPQTNFRLVGVNYGACVKRTALGLVDYGMNVVVVKRACHQPRDWCRVCYASKRLVTEELVSNCVYVED